MNIYLYFVKILVNALNIFQAVTDLLFCQSDHRLIVLSS